MTGPVPASPAAPVGAVRVCVVGRPEAEWVLPHGGDVRDLLAAQGWRMTEPVAARRTGHGELVLEVAAEPATPTAAALALPPHDADLVLEPGEVPHVHQRVAAYALVRSDRGVLLTQLSGSTNAPGRWNLPGGGLDAGEDPAAALHREIWEETGQQVGQERLVDVVTGHWVGRAPNGRVEDFHAVRLLYLAHCPQPSEPVVHDVGGSTADARWVSEDEAAGMPLAGFVADALPLLLGHGDARLG